VAVFATFMCERNISSVLESGNYCNSFVRFWLQQTLWILDKLGFCSS